MATGLQAVFAPRLDKGDPLWMASPGHSIVLHGISWDMYCALRDMPENDNLRMTYCKGELEIMSPSPRHGKIASLLGKLVEEWAVAVEVEIAPCRMMTIRRADLERGFEPDDCYYVQHERQMRDKDEIDFAVDPPPDLAIEVEVSRKLGRKAEIYAAFGVPEVWCWSGDTLAILVLSKNGEYLPADASNCFPGFPVAKVQEFVRLRGTVGHTSLVRSFRDWLRDNVLAK